MCKPEPGLLRTLNDIYIVSIQLSLLVNIRPDGDTNKGEGQQPSGYVL